MNCPYKKIKRIVLCAFFTSIFYNGYSQQIELNSVPQLDDYPSNSVTRIYQDKEGYIWLGTMDGICRYDGYRTLSFRSDFNRKKLLTNNQITSITEDENYIWIGTEEGLNLLDKRTYIILPFHDKEIQQQSIKSILIDKDQSIWIGTSSFIYHYTKNRKLIKKFNEHPNMQVNHIYQDSQGYIWILTWNSGLFKYNKENNTLISYPKIGDQNSPFRIFQDKNNQYWICTWGDGIYLFKPESDNRNMYIPQKLNFDKDNTPKKTFFSIAQDGHKGYIWVISFSGVQAFSYSDPANPVLQEIDIRSLFKESNNIFSELIKDKNGNIWIGTYNEGTHTLKFDKPVIKNYTLDNIKKRFDVASNVKVLYEDKDRLFWIFQNRIGLGTYNPQTNIFKLYDEYPNLRQLQDLKFISCITSPPSSKEEIWIGPESRSIIYRLKKDKDNLQLEGFIDLQKYTEKAGHPLIFFNDNKRNTWIGTTSSLFVKNYSNDSIRLISDTIGYITGITQDKKGDILISTSKSGIYKISTESYMKSGQLRLENWRKGWKSLTSNNIQTICADNNGQIWAGTKKGTIEVYNHKADKFEDLTKTCGMEGFPILNIICDSLSHIWILSSRSITEYNPQNKAYYNYKTNDGMSVNYFHKNSLTTNNQGLMFFGGNKGFVEFAPSKKLSTSIIEEKVLITDIEIQGKSVFYSNNNNKFDVEKQVLTLNPDDRNIEIRFSSLNYTYPSKIRFSYKLDGVDNDWVYTDANRQFASYNQLSKGKYDFLVRSTNENGLWSDKITKLTIYRLPAFYETWWAYTIYALIFGICLFSAYKTALNRIRLRNKLNIARIEREKTEELTQSKLRYFTNISHDFLTPLTIISCIIDDLGFSNKEIPQYDTIRSNINRLKRLLQQILDFRKVESGNMRLKISNSNIAVFIKDICYTNFAPLIKKNQINFSFITETNNINAYFDLDKIDKIVCNLLSNAFKYTPKGGEILVSISLINEEKHKWIQLKISDSGIGIATKDIDRIFTRFYSNKDNIKEESNGIGLSLTKDLIELHHGQVHVDSTVNEGTTFTVILPIDKESYTTLEITDSSEVSPNKDLIAAASTENQFEDINNDRELVSILLVEDNDDLLDLMNSILSRYYKVSTAINGKDALNLTKDKDIDIIISDVMMPEMDGLELCRAIKSDIETSHISVLLLTAKNTAEDRIECYDAGADGYLSKPFELKVLEARINNLVSNKKNKQKEFKSNVEINISSLEYASSDEIFLSNAIQLIEKYISEPEFGINTFAEHMNMSKSSLYRKIKSMTGLSPIEFIRNIRLKHACNMLKNKSISISEVAYLVGFSDPKYFTSCFKTEFEMTPSEYQRNT